MPSRVFLCRFKGVYLLIMVPINPKMVFSVFLSIDFTRLNYAIMTAPTQNPTLQSP